jgi:hypothetical protein
MYDRPPGRSASGRDALRRAVDIALTVAAQTEWLAGRPTIVPVIAPELDVPPHIQGVATNAGILADHLDQALEADMLVQHQDSDVVDVVSAVAARCRSFAQRWSASTDADAAQFNDEVAQLRRNVDTALGSLAPQRA